MSELLLEQQYPLIQQLRLTEELLWINPKKIPFDKAITACTLTIDDIKDAETRLLRFAPFIAKVFPETQAMNGIIESPFLPIPRMKAVLETQHQQPIEGALWLKCDSHLPISGSIKARGGIYEILKHAETLALQHQLITIHDDYSLFASDKFQSFFSKFRIAVGSTGNLGLSIGIISAKLGFSVTVHMSADAKEWKKDLLRANKVTVIEYDEDYSAAVEQGRKQAANDPNCHFVDDEQSLDLFLGYAVAAFRLQQQLVEQKITVDENHPLFVYLPCGVGGGPGGVAFGLKLLFKDHVHCFFAEPTHSPCMLLGMMTNLHDTISVQDIGLDNITAADGLAVGRPSGFVGKTIEPFLSGCYTINDERLFHLLKHLADSENLFLEPSALAGMYGPVQLFQQGKDYLEQHQLTEKMKRATHIVWGTGGSMVPEEMIKEYYQRGK